MAVFAEVPFVVSRDARTASAVWSLRGELRVVTDLDVMAAAPLWANAWARVRRFGSTAPTKEGA